MNDKLFMVLLGCRPEGRLTEQHDIFFGIAKDLKELLPKMKSFWKGVNLHIDAYSVISNVGEYQIEICPKTELNEVSSLKLFFINLGGYNPPDFEEYHKKILVVAEDISKAISEAKKDNFYISGRNLDPSAISHIDDKMEVDEIINIQDLIPEYSIKITKSLNSATNGSETQIGYLPFSKI